MNPTVGVVILTMGTRPVEFAEALSSVLGQRNVEVDVAVVGNGWRPVGLPDGVTPVFLPENVGIPDGRNAGVPHVKGDVLLFLDDDCALPNADFLADALNLLAAHPQIGMIQPQIVDPAGLAPPSRWTPRLGRTDPGRSGPVAAIVEMAVVVRRDLFERTGGWAPGFFYAHEGIDLAWRIWGEGAQVWYAADIQANHPVIDPRRHEGGIALDARNRVWLARRNLPAVLIPVYTGVWAALSTVRRHGDERRAWWRGFKQGWREDPSGRRPMSWSSVWRMTRQTRRPPVI